MRGVPAYDDDGAHGNNTLWFTASAPLEGSDANTMHEIAAKHLREVDHHAEYVLGWRTLFLRITIMYDAGTYAAHRKAALAAIKALIAAGYAISHDSFDLTAEITSQHTGKGLQHLYHGLRQALDPAGLFGPRNA